MKTSASVALLFSGGLDSAVLLHHLLSQGEVVQPLYIRCGLIWETDELQAARRFLKHCSPKRVAPLVVLHQPVDDLYGPHWSLTGQGVPDETTPDEAMYLPGRNVLLVTKAALWCHLQGIRRLALGVLGPNPFPDATASFFATLEQLLNQALGTQLRLERPFGNLTKDQVLNQAQGLPLELTFSCAQPQNGLHCGKCNKCYERKMVFRRLGQPDPTRYAL